MCVCSEDPERSTRCDCLTTSQFHHKLQSESNKAENQTHSRFSTFQEALSPVFKQIYIEILMFKSHKNYVQGQIIAS